MSCESFPTALGAVDSHWNYATDEYGTIAAGSRVCRVPPADSIRANGTFDNSLLATIFLGVRVGVQLEAGGRFCTNLITERE
jgi:hypothetical protein